MSPAKKFGLKNNKSKQKQLISLIKFFLNLFIFYIRLAHKLTNKNSERNGEFMKILTY